MSELPVNLRAGLYAGAPTLPPGAYLLEVQCSEVRTNADAVSQRVVFTTAVVSGPGYGNMEYTGRRVAHSYQLTDRGAPFLKRLFLACDITEEFIRKNDGRVEAEWLNGRMFVANLSPRNGYINVMNERSLNTWAPSLVDAAVRAPDAFGGARTTGFYAAASPAFYPTVAPMPIKPMPIKMPLQPAPAADQIGHPAPHEAPPRWRRHRATARLSATAPPYSPSFHQIVRVAFHHLRDLLGKMPTRPPLAQNQALALQRA